MKNPFSTIQGWWNERQKAQYEEDAKNAVCIDNVLFLDTEDGHPYTKMFITINGVHIIEVMPEDEFATNKLQIDNKDASEVLKLYRKRYREFEEKGRGARA